MTYKPWTTKEIKALKYGFEQGYGSTHRAWNDLLPKRSCNAIAQQARVYGFRTRTYKLWSKQDDETILRILDTLSGELQVTKHQLMGHISELYRDESRNKKYKTHE
ncbi:MULTISPECIES: hypothetical protein [Atopobium]|uniref:Uncharacterized protein n=1 Tax=Atopobium minutum 10063974 TaxID=997872 RepID=N2BQZ1_9ACTN|nr:MULTISPECIES: hypothetical protein [Atopobium]EMZ42691.1 hypothetical protein HMPREF1091_00249 [Atopobium minutum 10063974]